MTTKYESTTEATADEVNFGGFAVKFQEVTYGSLTGSSASPLATNSFLYDGGLSVDASGDFASPSSAASGNLAEYIHMN